MTDKQKLRSRVMDAIKEGLGPGDRWALNIDPASILSVIDELDACKADAERYRRLPKVECEGMVIGVGVDDASKAYEGWRTHSVNYAKGEKPPETIETLQAAWDRDQELLLEQKEEISRLKQKLNQARQKLGVDAKYGEHSIPDGYALVPIDPTPEMLHAGWEEERDIQENESNPWDFRSNNRLKHIYRAMLAIIGNRNG